MKAKARPIPPLRTARGDFEQKMLLRQHRSLVRAGLKVIAEALKEPAGGSYHPAREMLDAFDVFHDDLDDLRVINALVLELLRRTER